MQSPSLLPGLYKKTSQSGEPLKEEIEKTGYWRNTAVQAYRNLISLNADRNRDGLWESSNIPAQAPVSLDKAIPVQVVPAPATNGSGVKITKIEIITKQGKFEALKEAMDQIGITGMTVTNVLGYGIQGGHTEYYRGVKMETTLLPKIKIEIVVSKVPVRTVIETAKKVLYTGNIGDGKIFVYDTENVVKVRTGEEGYDALQDVE